MLPIGPLMWEHRLIERMIKLIKAEYVTIEKTKKLDLNFIVVTTDFLRTYADRCHHGKEEEILFRELARKNLSEIDRKMIHEKYAKVIEGLAHSFNNLEKPISQRVLNQPSCSLTS
jgi:hemerythrin-like domain-containing protein